MELGWAQPGYFFRDQNLIMQMKIARTSTFAQVIRRPPAGHTCMTGRRPASIVYEAQLRAMALFCNQFCI